MIPEAMLRHFRALTPTVVDLFRLCPRHKLDFRPAPQVRSLRELCDHLAALPLVDLSVLQGSPRQVAEAIEETLHGSGPDDWTEIYDRGAAAVSEFFERLPEDDFANRTMRAHYGTARTPAEWLLELIGHAYHHRGQLFLYLRMLNLPVDVEHLYT